MADPFTLAEPTSLPLSVNGQWQITLTAEVCRRLGWDSERTLLAVPSTCVGPLLALQPARYLLLIEPSVLKHTLQETQAALDQE